MKTFRYFIIGKHQDAMVRLTHYFNLSQCTLVYQSQYILSLCTLV